MFPSSSIFTHQQFRLRRHGIPPHRQAVAVTGHFIMTLHDLKKKHDKLKKLDGGGLFKSATYKTFGSDAHRYEINSCLTEDNTETEEFQKWEEEYFSNRHNSGSMRICHYACAIYYLLVATGKNTGQIWVDDRANGNGIYPAISKSTGRRLTFLEWYDEWLTESLNQFA
jgi:hypothetical protein